MIRIGGLSQLLKFILGVDVFMFYVGIDVAKNSHFASVMNSDCEVLVKPFKFSNDESGFNLLLDCIS